MNQLFLPRDVVLDLELRNDLSVFDVVGALWASHRSVDAVQVARCLAARERMGSTGLGQGVAIPHARIAGIEKTLTAFVRLANAIDFDAPDGSPVDCFVVLLVPQAAAQEHLELLAKIAKHLASPTSRQQLRAATEAVEVNGVFSKEGAGP